MSHVETDPNPQTWDKVWTMEQSAASNHSITRAISEIFNGDLQGKKVLEVGAGRGTDAIALAKMGAVAYGVDFSNNALTLSSQYAREKDASFYPVKADAEILPFASESLDLVYSQGLIEHFKDPKKLVDEQVRVTKKGGYVLIDVPQTISIQALTKALLMKANRWPFGWERNYTEGQLQYLMETAGLDTVDSYAWGTLPTLKFGIRGAINKYILNKSSQPEVSKLMETPTLESSDFVWGFQKSWVGRHSLNCIGIIGQKE